MCLGGVAIKKYKIEMTISFGKSKCETMHANIIFKMANNNNKVFSISHKIEKCMLSCISGRLISSIELIWLNSWVG